MIKRLEELYPNETMYSYFSRMYSHSGYLYSISYASEIFYRFNDNMDYNMLNKLNFNFRKLLEDSYNFEDIMNNHTLFKHIVRFMDKDRRISAYNDFMNNSELWNVKYPISNKDNYYLRYCPKCVEEDREKYGECYFHINHNFPYINICPKHRVRLIDTEIPNKKRRDSILIPLEKLVKDMSCYYYEGSDINYKIAYYINELYFKDIDLGGIGPIGDFLLTKIRTKYHSKNDKKILTNKCYDELIKYYGNECVLSCSQYHQLLENKTWNTYYIVLIALFLGVDADELCDYAKTNVIVERPNKKKRKRRKRKTGVNWKELDKEYSKSFDKFVKNKILEDNNYRINKINICELFNIKDKHLRNFPKLRNKIIERRDKTWRLKLMKNKELFL